MFLLDTKQCHPPISPQDTSHRACEEVNFVFPAILPGIRPHVLLLPDLLTRAPAPRTLDKTGGGAIDLADAGGVRDVVRIFCLHARSRTVLSNSLCLDLVALLWRIAKHPSRRRGVGGRVRLVGQTPPFGSANEFPVTGLWPFTDKLLSLEAGEAPLVGVPATKDDSSLSGCSGSILDSASGYT